MAISRVIPAGLPYMNDLNIFPVMNLFPIKVLIW
jgi:hypothetical protein